jgi:hypothetical protein
MNNTHRAAIGALLLGAVALSGGTPVETAPTKPAPKAKIDNQLQRVLKPRIFRKSGFIPRGCAGLHDGGLLTCWLEHYPTIAQSIEWEDHNRRRELSIENIAWPDWPAWRRADLEDAFVAARVWYEGGMNVYTGTLVADPPPNMEEPFGHQRTVLDETTAAWPLYVAHVAHGLAAEIYGWVPWSLRDYDLDELRLLFASHLNMFVYDSNIAGDFYDVNYPGYVLVHAATPSHPTFVFKFLKANHLVGSTPVLTIGNVLEWSRANLAHFFGPYTQDNWQQYWQYWGDPPVRRVIEGTHVTDPEWADDYPDLKHWTAGCNGTTSFLLWVMRAVNIPARRRQSLETCGHTMPHFPAENLYLSHGDDPYHSLSKANFPALSLLITAPTWKQWFESGDQQTSCDNVGRRPVELGVWYLGDYIVGQYCADVLNGKDHASGTVYAHYSQYYTVAQLEATQLWERLAAAAPSSGAPQCQGF